MKYGSVLTVCLVVLACVAVPSAFGDEATVALESVIIEDFNGNVAHEWFDGRYQRNYDYSWALEASKFTTKTSDSDGNQVTYPLSMYLDVWPQSLFRRGTDIKSFGINGGFDRQGYNWIDIYPVQPDGETPFEIPLPGRVRYLDLWVWGSNLNYLLEAYVKDNQGITHVIKVGDLSFQGWRNLRANIPSNVRQGKRILPAHAPLKFVKFRIWTQPRERVDNFYVYLKQFKILTDTHESFFDGDELADPEIIQELWANSGSGAN